MQNARYQIYPEEYDCKIRNPNDLKLYSIGSGKAVAITGAPIVADEGQDNQKGSGSLHHSVQIDKAGNVWTQGDNTCNISGLGIGGSTIPFTQTKIGNAKQVIAYANSGDSPAGTQPNGLGYGNAVVTNDNKLILIGNTQSGFRGDGTEGNSAEPGPYVVQGITKTIKKAAVGSFIYLLYTDGTVDSWGGTRLKYYPTYCLGRGVDNPDPTRPGAMVFQEPIVDLEGGSNRTLFVGKSGKIYGVAYDYRYLGIPPGKAVNGNRPIDITSYLALPATPIQLAVGPNCNYALLPNGDAYAWGDNSHGEIGNGKEADAASFGYNIPWNSWLVPQYQPVKINPAGVSFVKIFASNGLAFYVYYEDTNANLWNNGRNKGFVLWNGIGGNSTQQASQPDLWNVPIVTVIAGFGTIAAAQPPVVSPTAPRNLVSVDLLFLGNKITIPASSFTNIKFDDGSSQ